jgi:ABC-type bacteriocin/lantibiotic exporter with double-glycine peptidase domain
MKRILDMMQRGERWELLRVLILSIGVAVFETVGVATVLPFMAVVMDPSVFERYGALREFTRIFGLETTQQRLVGLGIGVGIVIVFSNACSALALWRQQRIAARIRSRISTELFGRFMYQSYSFHVANDGPTLQAIMINDVDALQRILTSALTVISRSCVVVALVALLLLQNPTVALCTFVVIGGSYGIIFRVVRSRQSTLGTAVVQTWKERQRVMQESLAGVKELQVLNRERNSIGRFGEYARRIAGYNATNMMLQSIPRYILEPIGFGGILAVALYMILTDPNATAAAIPTLALYAFVGYRLLPAMQQIYAAATEVKFSLPSGYNLHKHYTAPQVDHERQVKAVVGPTAPLSENIAVSLSNVSFTHNGANKPALKSISIDLIRGQSVGIVGKSGSGKTTLADVILGLYLPDSGTVRTSEGVLSEDTVRQWRSRLGYVPQHVFLANASVLENIALGLPLAEIDREAAARAARMALAADFIEQLPLGMNTIIGERGVVLSGGQRQRLGIARALYNNPALLVFDEATSALDGLTESGVMDAIHALSGDRTVILIAHRLQTIEACDRIIHLNDGAVIGDGTFEGLVRESAEFRRFTSREEPTEVPGLLAI